MTNDLGPGGRRLWKALLGQDVTLSEPANPVREVALEACRAKDRCDRLEVICREVSPILEASNGSLSTHPAWTEARQQATVLKQLTAALRLPDEATGKRPQRHAGAAAGRQPNGAGSARDRLKAV